MYTLYYSPGACSMSVHVALRELSAEFEAVEVNLSKGEHKQPEYLKINPRGQVGALQTPDGLMSENAAMIIYLNDTHQGNLLPASGFARAQALQWLMYANSTLHPAYSKAMFAVRNDASEALIKTACDAIQAQWDLVEEELGKSSGAFLCGDTFTAGDIYVAVIANWSFIPHLPSFGPKTIEYLKRVTSRPAYQAAIAAEQIEYKAAAA